MSIPSVLLIDLGVLMFIVLMIVIDILGRVEAAEYEDRSER